MTKSTSPKVFIGMMAYNGERFIEEAVDSLLAQTYPDFTLLISDDASTDRTAEICKRYAGKDARIVYHRQEKNLGMIGNFNFVLNEANLPYFMWAAQDDVWDKDFLMVCVNNLDKNPDIAIATGNIAEIDSYGRTLRETPDFALLSGYPGIFSVSRYILQPEILGKCNVLYSLFRLSAIRNIIDIYPLKLEWGYDYNFSLAAISHFGIRVEKRVLFKKRRGGFSNPQSTKNDKKDSFERISFKNPKNHMFPFIRFMSYLKGHLKALDGTGFKPIAVVLLSLRLPRAFLIYLKERDYKKMMKRTFLFTLYKKFCAKRQVWEPKISYSQCGEDIIIEYVLLWLKIKKPTYLDIGANDPEKLNNTYYFYRKNSRGVLVEPDPFLCARLKTKRRGDVCLNIGVGYEGARTSADFYIMSSNTLNTFSKEEAERYAGYGEQRIKEVRKIGLVPINTIIEENFDGHPNIVSLDTEGMDMQILRSLDWDTYRPEVFCIETLTYTENNTESKITEVIDFMKKQQYMVYADTYINTIFVDKKIWDNRKK